MFHILRKKERLVGAARLNAIFAFHTANLTSKTIRYIYIL
jgi:hypothetical protein